jgi:hypothetical protein
MYYKYNLSLYIPYINDEIIKLEFDSISDNLY